MAGFQVIIYGRFSAFTEAGPEWFAGPSLYDSSIRYSKPVLSRR
jgi:hypothetical protein